MSRPLSKPFAAPCRLEPRRLKAVELVLLLAHCGGAVILWRQPLPVWLVLALSVIVVASLLQQIRATRRPWRLDCDRYGRWSMLVPPDEVTAIEIRGATLASRLGLFLVYCREGRWRDESRFIPVFAMRPQDYRRIRQRLTVTVGRDRIDPESVGS